MSATTGLAGWLNRVSAAAAAALNRTAAEAPVLGALPGPAVPSAPPAGTPGASTVTTMPGSPEPGAPPAMAGAEGAPAGELPAGIPFPNPKTSLERLYNALWDVERRIAQAEADRSGGDADKAYTATQSLPSLTSNRTSLLSQIGAEENRQRDDVRAETERKEREAERREREQEAKAERERKAEAEPKEGDTRTSRVQHNGVWATITERYSRGQWSYVPGSAKAETGLLGERSEADALDLQRKQLDYDRAKTAYENETDETAKQTRLVALDAARTALQQAQQNLNRPTDIQSEGYLVRVRPDGTTERIDTLTPEQRRQRDEATTLDLEAKRRGTLPQNAYAAYTQEVSRLQGRAQQELDRLKALQQQGVLSAEQASTQYTDWFQTNVQGPLAGLRASAEEAQRAERARVEEANLQEERRVQAANAQREQLAQQYGEQARNQLIATFPSARSPEFAQAYGGNVAAMAQRAGLATAEERMKAPRGQGYTPQSLSAGAIQAVMPDPGAIAESARQRALAAISPAVALRQGLTVPTLPSPPEISALLGQIPYRGPLTAAPLPATGLLPTPGREAVDLGPLGQPGFARTYYGPNGEVYGPEWRIPG